MYEECKMWKKAYIKQKKSFFNKTAYMPAQNCVKAFCDGALLKVKAYIKPT